jgi:hypothetical protein
MAIPSKNPSGVSALFDVRGPLGFDLFKGLLTFAHLKRGGVRLVESLAFGTTMACSGVAISGRRGRRPAALKRSGEALITTTIERQPPSFGLGLLTLYWQTGRGHEWV